MSRKKMSKFTASEHEEQCTVVEFCRMKRIPIFAIPNGAFLNGTAEQRGRQMNKLKKEGLSDGVPDLFIPYPQKSFSGLFIEMKKKGGSKPSKEQQKWLDALSAYGYRAECCKGSKEAIDVIKEYFGRK